MTYIYNDIVIVTPGANHLVQWEQSDVSISDDVYVDQTPEEHLSRVSECHEERVTLMWDIKIVSSGHRDLSPDPHPEPLTPWGRITPWSVSVTSANIRGQVN